MRIPLFAWILVFAFALTAYAEPKQGTLKLRDGRTFKGLIEETPEKVTIKLRFGTVSYPRNEVFIIEYDDEAPKPKEEPKATPAAKGPSGSFIDRVGRFTLDAPEGWEVAAQSTHPALRAVMRPKDASRPLFFYASVEPFEGEYPSPNAAEAREFVRSMAQRAVVQSAAIFESKANIKGFTAADFFGTQVYLSGFSYRLGTAGYNGLEMRFHLKGFEYILRAGGPTALYKTAEEELRGLFESFSFLPPIDAADGRYLDLETGFEIGRPSEDWALDLSLFNRARPLEMKHRSGLASVKVEVLASSRSPSAVMSDVVRELKSRPGGEFEVIETLDGKRDGVSVTHRILLGFLKGERRAKELHYLLVARESGLVQVTGYGPALGSERTKMRAELKRVFDTIHIYDREAARETLDKAKDSLRSFSEAVSVLKRKDFRGALDKLNAVIEEQPGFVRAYYLRADCFRNLNRFEEWEADLTKILELNPGDSEVEQQLSKIDFDKGKLLKRQRKTEEAYQAMQRAFRANRKSEEVRKEFLGLLKEVYNKKKRKDALGAFDLLEDNERLFSKTDKDFRDLYINGYAEVAQYWLKLKKYSKAKRAARGGLKLDRDSRKMQALLKRIESEEERSRR